MERGARRMNQRLLAVDAVNVAEFAVFWISACALAFCVTAGAAVLCVLVISSRCTFFDVLMFSVQLSSYLRSRGVELGSSVCGQISGTFGQRILVLNSCVFLDFCFGLTIPSQANQTLVVVVVLIVGIGLVLGGEFTYLFSSVQTSVEKVIKLCDTKKKTGDTSWEENLKEFYTQVCRK